MTQKDKAEAYDKALNRAKKNYKTAQDYLCEGSRIGVECLKNTLTNIFPELAESEDEKIRKDLIRFIKGYIRDEASEQRIAYLDWIEKQGVQKSQRIISAQAKEAMYDKPSWSEEDEHRAKDTIYFLEVAKKHYASTIEIEACIDWLKSLKERLGGE